VPHPGPLHIKLDRHTARVLAHLNPSPPHSGDRAQAQGRGQARHSGAHGMPWPPWRGPWPPLGLGHTSACARRSSLRDRGTKAAPPAKPSALKSAYGSRRPHHLPAAARCSADRPQVSAAGRALPGPTRAAGSVKRTSDSKNRSRIISIVVRPGQRAIHHMAFALRTAKPRPPLPTAQSEVGM
jgi:hypothetical protein